MARKSRQDPAIQDFILRHVGDHTSSIVAIAMEKFQYTRPAILRYIHKLVSEGLLVSHGNTSARHYQLKPIVEEYFTLTVDYLWAEDKIWRERILPLMKNVRQNIVDICQYGFTEMLNNVLDHARSPNVFIAYYQDYAQISITIADRGIGIFKKIQHDFKLDDPRTALLELSKGKLTSDKKNHSGEGIYFTSRAFDRFRIRSGNLFYSCEKKDGGDWLMEVNDRTANREGTIIGMRIRTDAEWPLKDIFSKYQGDNLRFRKTHIPLKLGQYPGEQLVSRSQAKRILVRFENFSEVFLDFDGVEQVGQAFTDEIFRVYHEAHPGVVMRIANASESVRKMIEFVNPESHFVQSWRSEKH